MGNFFRKTYEIPVTFGSVKLSSGSTLPPSFTKGDVTQPKPTSSSTSLLRTPSSAQMGPILKKLMVDINSLFMLEKELGRGQFGITYQCTEKATGLKYACKSVSKRKLVRRNDIEVIQREVLILQHLTGQPNIVELKGAYEDRQSVHLVMELCSGGDLFDRIKSKGSYSEQKAAAVCRDIVNVVHVCHFMGVIHRDLRLENFLLTSKDEDYAQGHWLWALCVHRRRLVCELLQGWDLEAEWARMKVHYLMIEGNLENVFS